MREDSTPPTVSGAVALVMTDTRTLLHESPGRDPCTGVTRRSSGLAGLPEWVPRAATVRSKSETEAAAEESSRNVAAAPVSISLGSWGKG